MYKLVILIEQPQDEAAFEARWPDFLKPAERMPGLLREVTSRVHSTVFGAHPASMIHELYFASLDSLKAALSSPEGILAGQILQRITRGNVTLLFAEHLEDELANIRPPEPVEK